jgi:hypothetical protein
MSFSRPDIRPISRPLLLAAMLGTAIALSLPAHAAEEDNPHKDTLKEACTGYFEGTYYESADGSYGCRSGVVDTDCDGLGCTSCFENGECRTDMWGDCGPGFQGCPGYTPAKRGSSKTKLKILQQVLTVPAGASGGGGARLPALIQLVPGKVRTQ